MKKEKGSVDKYGIPLFTMVAIFIILMISSTTLSSIKTKDKIDVIARKYLLRMEATGYLNSTDEADFITELTNKGMRNISLSGTTRSEVGYGNEIYLMLNGEVAVETYEMVNIFTINKITKYIRYEPEPLSSISKN